ncbi:MAG TPA: ABC transporter substrate-binding protein [Candidatus Sulfotelmatobacter sp.]|nr:ABC transporter substrate-binding protein [Candidatus Sulfotelmatobacter sp.]
MTTRGALQAMVALALLGAAAATAVVAQAADPYRVDVILPLTGGGSFLGKAEQQALQLLEKSINQDGGIQGRPLQLDFQDDQTSPQVAVQLASQVVAKHPAALLGSSLVAMCNAMAPLMQSGPVMYCMSPGIHPPKDSYVFTSSVSTHDLAIALIRYFRLRGWTRLGVMTSSDATGQDAEKGILEAVALPENKGVQIVARTHFATTDVSVAAQIETVKAAQPQAFIAWSTGTPIATIFKGVIQAGLDVPVATTDGNMTRAQMAQYAAFLPAQLYFPAGQWVAHGSAAHLDPAVTRAQDAFYETYKAAGMLPDAAATHGWGPGGVVLGALRKLGPGVTAPQLREYLAHLKGEPGINGIYDFEAVPQRGLSVNNAVVARWNAGKNDWETVSEPAGTPLAR